MGLQTMLLSLDFFDHLINHIFSTLMRFEVGYLRHVCPFGHTNSQLDLRVQGPMLSYNITISGYH